MVEQVFWEWALQGYGPLPCNPNFCAICTALVVAVDSRVLGTTSLNRGIDVGLLGLRSPPPRLMGNPEGKWMPHRTGKKTHPLRACDTGPSLLWARDMKPSLRRGAQPNLGLRHWDAGRGPIWACDRGPGHVLGLGHGARPGSGLAHGASPHLRPGNRAIPRWAGNMGPSWAWDRARPILLPAARHLEERLTVSQSVSQATSQSGSQSGKQAGRQAGRNRQFGFFFSVADYNYKHWGDPHVQEHPVVEWWNTRPMNCLAPVRIPAGAIGVYGVRACA